MNLFTAYFRLRLGRYGAGYANGVENVASSQQFHALLARECCRADRNGAVFSVILFRLNAAERRSPQMSRLLRTLQSRLRLTDQIGWSNEGRLGVFLPDTSPEGARTLADELAVLLGAGSSPRACAIHSYPLDWRPDSELFTGRSVGAVAAAREAHERRSTETDTAVSFAVDGALPAWKRVMDFTGALVGLLVLAPVMIVIAAAVKLTSRGPVIFKQPRIGYLGQEFLIYKFRSMAAGASEAVHVDYVRTMVLGTAEQQQAGAFKLVEDARITRVGGFLRKWSLDELPQLVNVLKGEMSLVGPRPDPAYARVGYRPWYHRRTLHVRPGLTGLWQVEGRSRVTFEEMVRLDLRYSNSLSFTTDVGILLRTFRAVLSHAGAY